MSSGGDRGHRKGGASSWDWRRENKSVSFYTTLASVAFICSKFEAIILKYCHKNKIVKTGLGERARRSEEEQDGGGRKQISQPSLKYLSQVAD